MQIEFRTDMTHYLFAYIIGFFKSWKITAPLAMSLGSGIFGGKIFLFLEPFGVDAKTVAFITAVGTGGLAIIAGYQKVKKIIDDRRFDAEKAKIEQKHIEDKNKMEIEKLRIEHFQAMKLAGIVPEDMPYEEYLLKFSIS